MYRPLLTLLILAPILNTNAQKAIWEDFPFKEVEKISKANDSIVNQSQFPILIPADNGLAYRISTSESLIIRVDPDSKRIKEEFDQIVNSFLNRNQIIDNNSIKDRYAITNKDNQYKLRKHQTIKRYLYGEGSGVKSYISIDEDPGYYENEVFCIFNDNVDYPNSDFTMFEISSANNDRHIEPNKKITFIDKKGDLEFIYHADLCKGFFEYKGYGTVFPTYFNISLNVKDLKTGKIQSLLKIPHENLYRLNNIQIADFNNDKVNDIILQLETELCILRLIYISEPKNKPDPFRFAGHMIVYCDYP